MLYCTDLTYSAPNTFKDMPNEANGITMFRVVEIVLSLS